MLLVKCSSDDCKALVEETVMHCSSAARARIASRGREELPITSDLTPRSLEAIGEAWYSKLQESSVSEKPSKCSCDFVTQVLPYGCKCGGK